MFLSLSPLACWVKIPAADIYKYFSFFSQKTGFDILCKLSLEPLFFFSFPRKQDLIFHADCLINLHCKCKENIINLSSAEFGQRVVKTNS